MIALDKRTKDAITEVNKLNHVSNWIANAILIAFLIGVLVGCALALILN